MKVLYIASGTGMAGGATKSFISMILQVRSHGVEVEVICPDSNGLTKWLEQNGIKTHVVNFRHSKLPHFDTIGNKIKWLPRLLHDFWINYRAKSAVQKIAEKVAPDIIHENSSVLNVGFEAAKKLGIPDIIHIREYGDLDFGMKLPGRAKRLSDSNTYTISITKDIRKYLDQDKCDQSIQIYDGIMSASDFRLNINKERWLLYAGRVENAKGIDILLEVYTEYAEELENPLPLYVCGGYGDLQYFEKMKKIVGNKGLDSKVVWMGERDDLADFMYRTAATIVPSRFEGLGRILPEAMANGSLCIGHSTGGTKEQMENGYDFTGGTIAISYTEKAQLKETLLKLTKNYDDGTAFLPDGEYMKMITRAQDAVREYFSVERFGDKIMEFYDTVLNSRKSKTAAEF